MSTLRHLCLLLLLLLSGCSWLTPDYERPAFDMPATWQAAKERQADAPTTLKSWWLLYQDPLLTDLVNEALAGNTDIAVASAKLMQARAQYDYATANRLPMVGIVGLSSRAQADFKTNLLLSDKASSTGFIGGLLSYEVDLWGKAASTQEAASALFHGQDYAREAINLSVAAATAQLYFNILVLRQSLVLMQELVHTQEEMHTLVRQKMQVGAVPEITYKTSEAELAARKAEITKLQDQLAQAEGSLATLLGRSPKEILATRFADTKEFHALPVPPVTPSDLPADLLRQRPDLAALEQMLIASNFNIGSTRAAYFPTVSLSGLLGITGLDIDNIYKGSVHTWELGGGLVGPLVDFGRTASGVDLAVAKNQEQLARYKAAVQTAFKEVRDALSAQEYSLLYEAEQQKREVALEEALTLIDKRFSLGFASYLDVLPIKRSLLEAKLMLVNAKLSRLNASIALCKSLGGGWEMPNRGQ